MSTRQLSFDIKGWNFQNEATAVLSAALNRIPRVRELQLYMDSSFVLDLGDLMAWHGASCLLQQLAQLPADELVKGLHRLYLGPGVDMPSLPSSPLIFVNLTVLSVQCSGIDEDNMYTLLSPAVTPSLRVLSLGYLTTADRRQMLRWMQPPTPDLLTRLDLVSLGIVDRLLPVLEQPACGAQGPTIVHHCGLTGTWGLVPATAHHLTHRRDISHVAVFVPHGTSDEESALRGWTRDEELRSWAKVFDTALVAAEYADGLRWLFLPRHLQPAEEGREDEEETDEVYRELRDATLAAVARRDGQAEVVWLEADTEEEGTLEIWDWVKGKKAEERISRGEERKEGA
ncbi:uncharacterized protein JCM10292_001793 [Rhodotorula paludigena]|uniref:uncharacterized protein n=1 Tax=Rhodotorula paludigena TaxID=86838 RepID=UPI0031748AB4